MVQYSKSSKSLVERDPAELIFPCRRIENITGGIVNLRQAERVWAGWRSKFGILRPRLRPARSRMIAIAAADDSTNSNVGVPLERDS